MAEDVVVLVLLHDFGPLLNFEHFFVLQNLFEIVREHLVSNKHVDRHKNDLRDTLIHLVVHVLDEVLHGHVTKKLLCCSIFVIVGLHSEFLQARIDFDCLDKAFLLLL